MQVKNPIIEQTLANIFSSAGAANITPPPSNPAGDIQPIRLLFLDIDGVLNSHKTQVIYGTIAFPGSDSSNGYVDNAHATDRLAAELVNKLCEATGAYIVVSSSWRVGSTLAQVRIMLETLGVNPKYILGKTDTMNGHRGGQIARFKSAISSPDGLKWLKKCELVDEDLVLAEKVYVESYAIVDDDSDMREDQKPYFVNTTFMDGLTCALAVELGKILSNDETFHINALAGKPSAGAAGEAKFH
jgi:hypothetical protein